MFNIFGKKKKSKEENAYEDYLTPPTAAPTSSVAAHTKPTTVKSTKVSSDSSNFLQFDDFDESNLEVTEADMQDPEMLAMLDSLGQGHAPKPSKPPKTNSHSKNDLDPFADIEDTSVPFSAHDLQDPALHAELAALSSPKPSQDTMEDLIDVFDGPTPVIAAPKPSPVIDDATRIHVLKLKKQAVTLMNEGNTSKAKEILREAKSIESGAKSISTAINIASQKTTDKAFDKKLPGARTAPSNPMPLLSTPTAATIPIAASPPVATDAFMSIISTIQAEIQQCLTDADSFRTTDPKKARQFLDTCATYRVELAMMESRRHIPGALPPAIRWDIDRKVVEYEDSTLTDTQVRVCINRVTGIDAMLKNAGGSTIYITMEVTGVKEQSQSCTKPVKYEQGSVDIDFVHIFDIRKAAMKNIHIKKCLLTLMLKGGIFTSDSELGTVKFPLTALSSACETGGSFPIVGSRAAGSISAMVYIKKPSITPEKREVTERKLVVIWPEESPPMDGSVRMSESRLSQASEVDMRPSTSTPRTSDATATVSPSSARFNLLTAAEKNDPLAVDYLVSLEVLSSEAEDLAKAISACKDNDELTKLNIRKANVDMKLTQGTLQIQREELSAAEYLQSVRDRLKRDELLAVYCLNEGRKPEAVKLMRRIKIMKSEVAAMEEEMASMNMDTSPPAAPAAPAVSAPPASTTASAPAAPTIEEKVPVQIARSVSPVVEHAAKAPAIMVQQNSSCTAPSPAAPQSKVSINLSDAEKGQPFSLDLLVSMEVLAAESEEIGKQISACKDEDEAFELKSRKASVDTKLNLLSLAVQGEKLSAAEYLQSVRDRLKRDELLAVYCLNEGRKPDAVKLMRRIKIMKSEVAAMEEEMASMNMDTSPPAAPAAPAVSAPPASTTASAPVSGPQQEQQATSTPKKIDVSQFSPDEIANPLAIQFMEGDEVMKAEISKIETQLEQLRDGDPRFVSLNTKKEQIEQKMFDLFMSAQEGKLTLSMYMKKLDAKAKASKLIAVYCLENGRKPEALELMKRAKTMEAEVANIKSGVSMFADSFTRK